MSTTELQDCLAEAHRRFRVAINQVAALKELRLIARLKRQLADQL